MYILEKQVHFIWFLNKTRSGSGFLLHLIRNLIRNRALIRQRLLDVYSIGSQKISCIFFLSSRAIHQGIHIEWEEKMGGYFETQRCKKCVWG